MKNLYNEEVIKEFYQLSLRLKTPSLHEKIKRARREIDLTMAAKRKSDEEKRLKNELSEKEADQKLLGKGISMFNLGSATAKYLVKFFENPSIMDSDPNPSTSKGSGLIKLVSVRKEIKNC